MLVREDIRNIAIIAHVDHGKTSLVDCMLKQSGIFRDNEEVGERILDSGDLERERGITILAKNTAIEYNGVKINIVDTPGHADFGGEVERVLKMVNSVLLVVDAFEGPMPQTRFVLHKALELNLKPIVVINKIDRPDARPHEVLDEIFDLFVELDASDEQLDFPVVYASAKEGIAKMELDDNSSDIRPLLDTIVRHVEPPVGDPDAPLQMMVSTIEPDEYVGRIAVGRIERGRINYGQRVAVCRKDGSISYAKIGRLYSYKGLKRIEIKESLLGDIVAVSGIEDINIGETICDDQNPEALPFVEIEEPTMSMTFSANNSPFAGTEGEYFTSRHLRDRLYREIQTNLSLKVEETDSPDAFKVSGRGELHLSVLIETMRREGYEFQVSRPEVIYREINGVKYEPMEQLIIDVPEEYMGAVMEKLGPRKAEMLNMHNMNNGYVRMEFKIPSRGLIGYKSEFMTDTKGNGIMHHIFMDYEPYKGDIPTRQRGSLVAFEDGETTVYGLYNAQERGTLFIGPGVKVYQGMVVGENLRSDDMDINVCKKKHMTNMRSSTADEALRLVPYKEMSLEQCMEFIGDDELIEVTPKNIRMRKRVLKKEDRAKQRAAANR
ncbi:translational GTPase TypA [Mahella australiensis]|uniref:Large ribosomal subunit assembly factor BipA n=1 Tax=Mahella australiensis (strain DSM 15567 / CIP 107919 / 50-1 BON) TaxID=697281 RepID=F3ZWN5_MAHA5|nr:translational GTPase TypA [Mahella australiensis]AEE96478.1 GTP-binding protein TypA [Mahella australiensis 50-1 BON]